MPVTSSHDSWRPSRHKYHPFQYYVVLEAAEFNCSPRMGNNPLGGGGGHLKKSRAICCYPRITFSGIRGVLQTPKLPNSQVTGKRWIFMQKENPEDWDTSCLIFAKSQGLTLSYFTRPRVRPGMFLKMSVTSCDVSPWVRTARISHHQNPISFLVQEAS